MLLAVLFPERCICVAIANIIPNKSINIISMEEVIACTSLKYFRCYSIYHLETYLQKSETYMCTNTKKHRIIIVTPTVHIQMTNNYSMYFTAECLP